MADRPLRDLLAAFASAEPVPAGGSASALASAVGVSLLLMATRLPRTRSGTEEDRRLLTSASLVLARLQDRLTEAFDRDANAYRQLIAARGAARQDAIRGAIDAPLHAMRWSAEALTTAPVVAGRCHVPAATDVSVGIDLVRAGFAGARACVLANLPSLGDETYRTAVREEVDRLSTEAGVP